MEEPTPAVRPARPDDLPRLVELIHEHIAYDRLGANGLPKRRYGWPV
ncbi:hypothetical protein [Streptomyces sp. Isolate_45]|nr:hypothetical protein [Streptomyces sp. Isolate_45]MDA5284382.1 hypothetical protein [Streptomyces sp. Isolate_45]